MRIVPARRSAVLVFALALLLLPAATATAATRPVKANLKLSCAPETWQVAYTAGSTGHAPGATVRTRIDIGVVDEYGPDKVTGAPPYGLGSATTTGDVDRKADAKGSWSTREVLSQGPRPAGHPRSRERTTTVSLRVEDGPAWDTASAKCTLRVG